MGKIISSKSGIFFTFIAITIMGVFILIFTPQNELSLKLESDSVEKRIDSANSFVIDVEANYYPDVLRASTYKSILSLVYYMNQTGSYIPNLDAAFSEVAIYGTIGGVPIDSITGKAIMENSTLLNWSRKIEQAGLDTFSVNTTINVTAVGISQVRPWEIEAWVSINYTAATEVAYWSVRNTTIRTSMSIEGWQDPAYLVETGGLYPNTIKRSKVEFNQWNVSVMREHIINGTYVYWPYTNSPSYLARFTGIWTNSNSSCCGIHSLIRPGNLSAPSTQDSAKSYVDYMFWNETMPCALLYNITSPNGQGPYTGGIWDQFRYFKLDSMHLERYNITSGNFLQGGC